MQARRNKLLAASLIILVVASVWLLLGRQENNNDLPKNLFRVDDFKQIDRVVMQSVRDTVDLKFNGTRWMVNDIEAADRDMIDVLFATMLQAEPRRAVSPNRSDSVLQRLNKTGVAVHLFAGTAEVKQFLAGGNEQKTQAYFADGEGEAYVMNIPGYSIYVSGIFELPATDWYNKLVFALNWTNFRQLETILGPPQEGFVVELKDGQYNVKGMATDTTRLYGFLDAVSQLAVSEYADHYLDSGQPKGEIKVTDLANREYSLEVYKQEQRGKTACRVNKKHWAWIDSRLIATLLQPRRFYAKKA